MIDNQILFAFLSIFINFMYVKMYESSVTRRSTNYRELNIDKYTIPITIPLSITTININNNNNNNSNNSNNNNDSNNKNSNNSSSRSEASRLEKLVRESNG